METLTPEDQALFLTQVNRLADQHLEGLRLTREDPPRPGWQQEWRIGARAAGLLCEDPAGAELMLWSPGMEATSVQVLRQVAQRDAGAALLLHREAQGCRWLAEWRCGEDGPVPALIVEGAMGLGRGALARWLSGRALAADDDAELESNWGAAVPRVLITSAPGTVVIPVRRQSEFQWWRIELRDSGQPHHSHAFEGLSVAEVTPESGEPLSPLTAEALLPVLIRDQMALLAIGAGVVDQARAASMEYAGQRRQGGRLIREWPAVQQLLADITAVAETLEDFLAQPPVSGTAGLARLMRRRARLSVDSCRCCNQAMQVFGGTGYMRDLGIERLVREANALRVMAGSPLYLPLLAQQLEET